MEIAIPEDLSFKAEIYNTTTKAMQQTMSEKVCYKDFLDSGEDIVNCKLEIMAHTPA